MNDGLIRLFNKVMKVLILCLVCDIICYGLLFEE